MMMGEMANNRGKSRQQQSKNSIIIASAQGYGSTAMATAAASSKKLKTSASSVAAAAPRTNFSSREKKDKIGEKVAALQQLVSPFGKTDTASVLEEASAYIKFLHQQLQVLSSPYLRNSVEEAEAMDPEYYSLRSRGLCLVQLSAMQQMQVAQSNGADLWAPATSGGRRR